MKIIDSRITISENNLLDYKVRLQTDIKLLEEEIKISVGLEQAEKIAILEIYKELFETIKNKMNKISEVEEIFEEKFEKWS